MKTGWISLYRKIQDNFLWKDGRKFSRAEAWIDILMEVRHDEKQDKIMLGNVVVTCDRGQSVKSIETWAMRWNWSRSAVWRFLSLLKREEMILTENLKKTIRITVCSYNTYQNQRNGSETQVKRNRNASETHLNTDNNVKNANNDKNEKKKLFDVFRKLYPGKKNGLEPEWKNFTKKHKDWRDILPLLRPAVQNQIAARAKVKDGEFVAGWKMLSTWINKSCWTEEAEQNSDGRDCIGCGAPFAEGHKYQMIEGAKKYKCPTCRGA